MERRPDSKNGITKTRRFSQKITKKLGSSKKINRNGKRSHKETVQQEKIQSTRTEVRRHHVATD